MKSAGLVRAKVTMSSQVGGDCSRPNELVITLMGPSNSFSNDFSKRGPTSFAPRLAAKLSCRCKTPKIVSIKVLSNSSGND